MVQLEISIPEDWAPPAQEGAADETFFWRLRNGQGRVTRAGADAPASLPQADSCSIVLPAGRVTLSSVRPPARNRKKFMQALSNAVEDRIMADPESVHVAAGPLLENGEMPVAIVAREWLQGLLETLRRSGFKPLQAEVETLLAPHQENTWTLVWRGRGGFLRQGEHAGLALDGGGRDAPPPALLLALAESASRPASIRLYTDGAEAPDMEQWSACLGLPVKAMGEWGRGAPGQGINLLQGGFAPASASRDWLPRLKMPLVLGATLLGLHIAFSIADLAMLRHEKNTLAAAMEQGFRAAFPEARVIVDAPLQMRRNLAGLRHAAGLPDRGDFLPLLGGVAPLLGKDARLQRLDYRDGGLKLDLLLPNPGAAEDLRTRLQGMPDARLHSGGQTPAGIEGQVTIGAKHE